MNLTVSEPLNVLLSKLKSYPHVQHQLVHGGCEIAPTNNGGFKVGFYPSDGGWMVCFGENGMHEEFSDPIDALDFVGFGLSDSCRLRETEAPFLVRSIVERRDEDRWTTIYEVGLLRWPWPLNKRERIFQNTLIER